MTISSHDPPLRRRYLGTLGLAPTDYKIERKPHPDGEEGVLHSLRKVQQMVTEGMVHPTVRSWTIDRLKKAGNPKDAVGRAKAILEAIRKEKIWVPDPTNTEMMQGAHLTLGGAFEGGDCDDLVIATLGAYLSACSTVGVLAAVVGHSYGASREVTHVLGAILDGQTWHYVEPSTDKVEFGDAYSPTREVVLFVPASDGQIACDADQCLTGGSRVLPNFEKAAFVGINGLGLGESESAFEESGDPDVSVMSSALNAQTSEGIGAWVLAMLESVIARRDDLLRSYQALVEIAEADGRGLEGDGWGEGDTEKTRKLVIAGDTFAQGLSDVLQGRRPFKFATESKSYGWDTRPGEPEVVIQGDDIMLKGDTNPSVFLNAPPIFVSAPPVAAAGAAAAPVAAGVAVSVPVILITLAVVGFAVTANVYAWARLAEYQTYRAQEETRRRIADLYAKCLSSPDCTPDQRELIGRAFGKAAQGLQPTGTPLDQRPAPGTGEGSGYGWSWLGWPLLLGLGTLAVVVVNREYTRAANRARRVRRRDERERAQKSARTRERYAPVTRIAGVDSRTGRAIAVVEEDDAGGGGLLDVLRSFLCRFSSFTPPSA